MTRSTITHGGRGLSKLWLQSPIARFLRERRAQKRLAEIVASTRDSYECRRFREKRAAALKGLGKA